MDNNYYNSRRPRKRVTRQMARRRQLTALAVIGIILFLGIVLIANACSDKSDKKGDKKNPTSQSSSSMTTTAPVQDITTTTTTLPVATADPNDPNTITKIDLTMYEVYLKVGESKMPIVSMTPSTSTEKGEIWESSDEAVATVDWLGNITAVGAGECYVTVTSENNPIVYAEVKVVVTGDTPNGASGQTPTNAGGLQQTSEAGEEIQDVTIETLDGCTYVKGILIANKSYALPADYAPGFDPTTESQFNALSAAAAEEGLDIYLHSGYRSYEFQNRIFNNYTELYGRDVADTFSARPGHSEHQTGFAIDVNSVDDSFAGTPEAKWLAEHAHEFGFIIRYPEGKSHITGYKYEPWHIRYLGVEIATEVYDSGLTLEEFLGINSVYSD